LAKSVWNIWAKRNNNNLKADSRTLQRQFMTKIKKTHLWFLQIKPKETKVVMAKYPKKSINDVLKRKKNICFG